MNIQLTVPQAGHERQALAFRQEFFDRGERVINGSELLDQMEDYGQWLESITRNARADTVNPDWVLTDTFFAMDGEGELVGIIDLRHELKGFLVDFGHCGYSVRPTRRRQGIATEMLRLVLDVARAAGMKELQLSVEQGNEPSVKTITKNGGRYLRSFALEDGMADVYKIRL